MAEGKPWVTPDRVTVWEVCPRDGFQMEPEWIPTDQKVRIIRELAKTGIKHIEVTSFVHPKAIPNLSDAEEVVSRVQDLEGVQFRALIPNLRGAQRAIQAGIKKFKLMLSATDSHSLSNMNCLTKEAQEGHLPMVELAVKHGVKVGGSIAVAFGCPFEGKVPIERIISIIEGYRQMGINDVSLADTSGVGNPKQVYEMLGSLQGLFPSFTFSMHLHNTRGLALANAVAALQQGVVEFDSSIAGLGGCPYAPGASGNVATEDLVDAFSEMGIDTGINLSALLEAAKEVKQTIGHDGGSFVLKAGPSSKLYAKATGQQKLVN